MAAKGNLRRFFHGLVCPLTQGAAFPTAIPHRNAH